MIVAAGHGTRLRPLSELRPKPTLPVRGVPLIAYSLELLAHHGIREVVINAHHLPELLIETARRWCPPGLELQFSVERQLLGTGGAIRRAVRFLRESDPCLILAGDMILDTDLSDLVQRHRERSDSLTLMLRDDPRVDRFGSIGVDTRGRVRRIGRRFDLGGECEAGLYVWVNVVSPRAFDWLPDRDVFGHLDDWVAPRLRAGADDIGAEIARGSACTWEPVGTLAEYLHVNLNPPRLSYFDPDPRARAAGTRLEGNLVVGAGATLGPGASLRRSVIWDGEQVPAGLEAEEGVFAGGRFHRCAGDAP